MKKSIFVLLTALFVTAGTAAAFADGMDEYYDYMNDDGTYSYYFSEQGVSVTMSEEWYQNTMVIAEDNTATFYHRDSYQMYEAEGYKGGRLFTIAYSEDDDYEDLPSYEYLGYDEEEMLNYFVVFPTDVQAYMKDEDIAEEYRSLYASVGDVVDSIEIEGIDYDDDDDDSDINVEMEGVEVAGGVLSGGWTLTDDITIDDDTRELFDSAVEELVGADYEPVALLATQVVAGTNYCFLCRETLTVQNTIPFYTLVYIYEDLMGDASVLGFDDIEIGDFD